jgi:hypothetical protein
MDIGTGLAYIVAQFLGAAFGVIIGNLIFGLDPITVSDTVRTGRASAVPSAVGGIVLVIVLATSSTGLPILR